MEIDKLINSFFGSSDEIWSAIKKYALIGSREATQMMLQMYYCLKAPSTPFLDKVIIVAGLGYQLLPQDALPVEKYKFLGVLDNGITLALAYNKVRENVTPAISAQVDALLSQWFPVRAPEDEQTPSFPPSPVSVKPIPTVIPSSSTPEENASEDDLIVD